MLAFYCQRYGLKLRKLLVVVAVEGDEASQQPVMERDLQPLILSERSNAVEGVIVGFGINGSKRWGFIGRNSCLLGLPVRELIQGGHGLAFYLGEQLIVGTLQHLVIPCLSSEVDDQLKGANHSHTCAYPARVEIERGENVANRRRAQDDDKKVERAVPRFEVPPARRVIEGVAQDVEAQIVAVHFLNQSFLMGGFEGGADGVTGCLGPWDESGFSGWRGPCEWIDICKELGPLSSYFPPFSAMKCISFRLFRKGMTGVGGRLHASRPRQATPEIESGKARIEIPVAA